MATRRWGIPSLFGLALAAQKFDGVGWKEWGFDGNHKNDLGVGVEHILDPHGAADIPGFFPKGTFAPSTLFRARLHVSNFLAEEDKGSHRDDTSIPMNILLKLDDGHIFKQINSTDTFAFLLQNAGSTNTIYWRLDTVNV